MAQKGEKPKQVMPEGFSPPPPLQKPGSASAFEFKRFPLLLDTSFSASFHSSGFPSLVTARI